MLTAICRYSESSDLIEKNHELKFSILVNEESITGHNVESIQDLSTKEKSNQLPGGGHLLTIDGKFKINKELVGKQTITEERK